LRKYENESSLISSEAQTKNLPNIAMEVKERKIKTAINNKNNLLTFYNSKSKIKNKLKEESQEKAEHIKKYHWKNMTLLTKTMSKVSNNDENAFLKSQSRSFRNVESPHYPMK